MSCCADASVLPCPSASKLGERRRNASRPIFWIKRCDVSSAHQILAMEPTMFNPDTGRLDAERIARELNVPVETIAEAIRQKASAVRKSPDASSLQDELRRLYRIWVALLGLFAGNKTNTRIFLNAPNRSLEDHAPIEFMRSGNFGPLELFIDAMSVRQPT